MFTTLPFLVCLFWLIFLLLEWKRRSHASHYLALFAAVSTLLYLCHALYFNGLTQMSSYANTLYSFCNIAVFPIYYIYICRLTCPGRLDSRLWLILLPALGIAIWTGFDFFVFAQSEQPEFWRQTVAKSIFVVQLILVTYFGWKKIRDFDCKIKEFYSHTENRTANMTSDIIFILSLCALISVVFSYIGREYFIDKGLVLYVPSTIFSVCLYAVLYIGYRQTFTADDMANDERLNDEEEYETPSAEESPAPPSAEYAAVCKLIEENLWYLRSDLRLPELALLVGIGRTRLSILINENSGMSFSDFINKYRVDYACRLLKNGALDKDIVLSAIGAQCGFMSDSSFYRSFKKFTGMTPAQYQLR